MQSLNLECIGTDHREAFRRVYSDPEVTRMNGRTTEIDVLFERYLNNPNSYAIMGDEGFLGVCSLLETSLSSAIRSLRLMELVYTIDPACWNKGIGTWAVKEVCRRGFQELKLDCIIAGCFAENTASARVLQKCCFKPVFVRAPTFPSATNKETIYIKVGL